MARKIAVFGSDQEFGEARTFVKKSVAQLLVRRMAAGWVEDNFSIRMGAHPGAKMEIQEAIRDESAVRLPRCELPGLKFIGPRLLKISPEDLTATDPETAISFMLAYRAPAAQTEA